MDTTITNDPNKDKWIENISRVGILSKGIVYCLLGILAFLAAIGSRQEKASKEGIFKFILEQPFGRILLALVALGLVAFVFWRIIQVVNDTEHQGTSRNGVFKRIGYALSGLIYSSMVYFAVKLVLDNSKSNAGEGKKFVVEKLLSYSYGHWVLGIIGIAIIGHGIYQIYAAYKRKFGKRVRQENMMSKGSKIFDVAGRVGYTARGIVLAIVGYFVLRAAMSSNSGEMRDTDGAFHYLHSSLGAVALGLVALGLIGYGICMFFMARYRDI